MRALAVLTLRNEGAFLLEWLAHHRAIGFTDFLILSNDCEDGTDLMLDRLADLGLVAHLPNPGPHEGGVQWAGLKRADRHPLVAAADWIVCLDIDEFVNIHTGDSSLSALFAALPQADAITLTWRLFGNGGIIHYEDRPVTATFLQAAPATMAWPWRAFMFKTLYRNNGIYRKLGVHRPRSPVRDRVDASRWFDGSGRPLGPEFRTTRLFSPFGRDNYGLAQINHYALGAMESYVLKAARGRAVHGADQLGMDYWVERNWNQATDRTILATAQARDAELAALMQDESLASLHRAAADWRKARFHELMLQDPYRALFGRLLMTPPSVEIGSDSMKTLHNWARKAHGLPD
jgi:hypothetical protein